jgi:hypothetical protein
MITIMIKATELGPIVVVSNSTNNNGAKEPAMTRLAKFPNLLNDDLFANSKYRSRQQFACIYGTLSFSMGFSCTL